MLKKLTPLAAAIAGVIAVSSAPVQAKMPTQHEYIKDSLLVVYKDNATKSERASAQRLVRASMRDMDANGIDDRFANLLDGKLAKLTLRAGSDVEQAIKIISRHPAVKYAEPNYVIKAIGTPDDPDFVSLWGLHNTGQDGGTADADIDAVEAWDVTTGDSSVIVGVIDTGVDYNHPDLQANMWVNPNEIPGNGIDDDGNGVVDDIHGFNANDNSGDPMDGNGHGTHVAGTIGASGNNGVGVVGVNWDVSIIGCQFLNASGSGSTEGAIACIDYMTDLKVNHGVDIKLTNNSWGGGGFSQALKDSIESGGDAGILFVAAAGNSAVDNDANPHYPSSYDSDAVMSIASTDRNDAMSSFSQWGLTSVDMGAPGSAILSTTPGNTYSTFSGTSMATPHIAGAAALVWSINPDLTPVEMKQLLMDSGDANADLTGKTVAGSRLNVANALDLADPEPGYRFSVTPASQTIEAGSATSYDYSVGSVAGWDGTVALSVAVSPALAGVTLSSNSVMAGESFSVDVATDAAAAWGDYTITVTGDDGTTVKSKSVALSVLPQGIQDFTYSNTDSVSIPDNDPAGIVSTIDVADDVQVFGVNADVDISHTWIGDLVVTLTSPAGTEVVLHNREGGNADDIVKNWDLSAFNGEIATGTWSLSVSDNVGADTGTLNSWGLVISGVGEAAPAAPVADFSYAVDGLNVAFTNLSSDVNDDIVNYSWDLGDGSVSTDMSPTHVYAAAGVYTVSMQVTDAEGNTDTASMDVEVFEHSITAGVTRAKLSRRGSALVDLTWDGAVGDDVVIYRDGNAVATTSNDGRYRDRFANAPASVEYKICEVATSLCSDPVTASF
ncbi:S8 family serine peptidase [Shewanella fidelis]|uniref:S8 family serine peptidase n=1 Tax=Shewanella fidelis TaxID=173509 RepID=A0AAW8NS38_9GAMM|nr:S8 family serine peptidase [Shewanella fidelis]MDR8525225.1 S8 family serine peptidase [Shewanella fidelis]MDW4811296.1 S8 family serine peptidase [Shewanella fidelis]MDW4814925.1 S8 family serine peptidase [Shewanella fidelis]MDW4819015.1 S8 family serine peptidase [Shewanella fidelis]MDW4823308.1 S8 family serine peptidase [Shewanella fidelis]